MLAGGTYEVDADQAAGIRIQLGYQLTVEKDSIGIICHVQKVRLGLSLKEPCPVQ